MTGYRLPEFWLDSSIFIEAAKGPYGFDIAPGFWTSLDQMVEEGRIASSLEVYRELTVGEDDLEEWARHRRSSGLFLEPDAAVQDRFRAVAEYVNNHYAANQASTFLDAADPWMIAHAAAYGGTVVTLETRVPDNSQKAKIPNVCDQFNVRSINTYQMLRELGAVLGR